MSLRTIETVLRHLLNEVTILAKDRRRLGAAPRMRCLALQAELEPTAGELLRIEPYGVASNRALAGNSDSYGRKCTVTRAR
jgi:hypothetical protein